MPSELAKPLGWRIQNGLVHGWPHWPRRLALLALRRVARDITIRHHHTGDPVRLNLFTHKGYWYHGRRREAATLALCRSLIRPGETVFDVGGHIGYLSLFFARLVGRDGEVHAFEPGENNLPYIERNVAAHAAIRLVRKAAGAADGVAPIYLESLAGQNNSLLPAFEGLARNAALAFAGAARVVAREVPVIRLDSYAAEADANPDFVKIDVEGFELEVLQGMERLLRRQPILLVEVQRNQAQVFELLENAGYRMFNDRCRQLLPKHAVRLSGANVFALHRETHAELIRSLFTLPPLPSSAPSPGQRNSAAHAAPAAFP
jgi:FkbM family methyltransferase